MKKSMNLVIIEGIGGRLFKIFDRVAAVAIPGADTVKLVFELL